MQKLLFLFLTFFPFPSFSTIDFEEFLSDPYTHAHSDLERFEILKFMWCERSDSESHLIKILGPKPRKYELDLWEHLAHYGDHSIKDRVVAFVEMNHILPAVLVPSLLGIAQNSYAFEIERNTWETETNLGYSTDGTEYAEDPPEEYEFREMEAYQNTTHWKGDIQEIWSALFGEDSEDEGDDDECLEPEEIEPE